VVSKGLFTRIAGFKFHHHVESTGCRTVQSVEN
jgi:hypothetical protein